MSVQTPVSGSLVGQGEAISTFLVGNFFRVEAFIDNDTTLVEGNHAEDVSVLSAGPSNAERLVQIVELDPQLQMLFDDILYWNRQDGPADPFMLVLREESLGVAFDLVFREEWNLYGHLVVILSSASELT